MQLHLPPVLKEIAALNARLIIFSFATLPKLQKWTPYFQKQFLQNYYDEHNLAMPADPFARTNFLADPNLTAYHAYGLGKNSRQEVYGFKILRQYALWKLQGKPIITPTEDPLQRGGNFAINQANRLTLSHTGRNQSERPAVADLLAALKA